MSDLRLKQVKIVVLEESALWDIVQQGSSSWEEAVGVELLYKFAYSCLNTIKAGKTQAVRYKC